MERCRSQRYKGDPERPNEALVDKVIKGGKGRWGNETGGREFDYHDTSSRSSLISTISPL